MTSLALFAVPAAAVLFALLWYNEARFGDPFRRSYLCTPEGLLHYTDEDRGATLADPVLWPYEHLRDPSADLCTGRAEAEAILGRHAAR